MNHRGVWSAVARPWRSGEGHVRRKIDRMLALTQALSRCRLMARLFSGNVRHSLPAGFSQTREEMQAVAVAIPQFRAEPPQLPKCPTIVLSAARGAKGRERQNAATREHQRRYADSLPDGRYGSPDQPHLAPTADATPQPTFCVP
jgi:hypothetical protein